MGWIDGESYSPLTDRERTFLNVTIEAQQERDTARQQLEGAVEALEEIDRQTDRKGGDFARINTCAKAALRSLNHLEGQ